MARLKHWVPIGGLLLGATLLSGCGSGPAVTDARHACTFVHQALADQRASQAPGLDSVQRAALRARALAALLRATPDAAAATSADGSWNPLQTTLEEANRVPLRFEIPALVRLCRVANSSTPYL